MQKEITALAPSTMKIISSRRQNANTRSGSVAPSSPPSPPSNKCGSPSKSTTNPDPPSSTESASKFAPGIFLDNVCCSKTPHRRHTPPLIHNNYQQHLLQTTFTTSVFRTCQRCK